MGHTGAEAGAELGDHLQGWWDGLQANGWPGWRWTEGLSGGGLRLHIDSDTLQTGRAEVTLVVPWSLAWRRPKWEALRGPPGLNWGPMDSDGWRWQG